MEEQDLGTVEVTHKFEDMMLEQCELNFESLNDHETDLDQKFKNFDQNHPEVYLYFKKFAKKAMTSGLKKYGAKAIFERIRWHFTIDVVSEDFKINNNYVSRYVRKLIDECPEFKSFFETRTLKS